jgi:hypothetical protein
MLSNHDNGKMEAAARAMGMAGVVSQPVSELYRIRLARPIAEERDGAIPPTPLPPVWEPGPTAILMMGLLNKHCRFPVGEGEGALQLFCGEKRMPRQPYCPSCMLRVATKGATRNPAVDA